MNMIEVVNNDHPDKIPGVIGIYSYTNEDKWAVPGLHEGMYFVDKWVRFYHDTDKNNFGYNESERFETLARAALAEGGKLAILTSPLVRYPLSLRENLIKAMESTAPPYKLVHKLYYFWEGVDKCYEYKNDVKIMTFTLTDDMKFDGANIHACACPINDWVVIYTTGLCRYYLGRLTNTMIRAKFDKYKELAGGETKYLEWMFNKNSIINVKDTVLGIDDITEQWIKDRVT